MKSKVAAKVKSGPKRVTRAASETARRGAFDRDLAAMKHPIDVYRDAFRLEPTDDRAQREGRELLEAATHAAVRTRKVTGTVSDSDTTLAALLSAGWLAHRRQRLGSADPALVALRGALDVYLATRTEGEIGQPLPALHADKGRIARAAAVRALATRTEEARQYMLALPRERKVRVAAVIAGSLMSTAMGLGLARGPRLDVDADVLVEALDRDVRKVGAPAVVALARSLVNDGAGRPAVAVVLRSIGWTREDANNAARLADD